MKETMIMLSCVVEKRRELDDRGRVKEIRIMTVERRESGIKERRERVGNIF